jgi:hypothetical protein
MENARGLPYAGLVGAGLLFVAALWSYARRETEGVFHLTELEIGLVASGVALLIFGLTGLISVLSEGQRLHPGRVPPRLTDLLTGGIVVFSLVLFASAVLLGYAIYDDWDPEYVGLLAGLGALDLALLLVFYKEAFVGDEATFDDREDGVPW